jgi:hypothetical protein
LSAGQSSEVLQNACGDSMRAKRDYAKVRYYLNPVDSASATEKQLRDLASRASGRL